MYVREKIERGRDNSMAKERKIKIIFYDTFDNEGIWYGFIIVQMTILLKNIGGSSDYLIHYYINGWPLNKNVNRQKTVNTWTVVSRFQLFTQVEIDGHFYLTLRFYVK